MAESNSTIRRERKRNFVTRLTSYIQEYRNILIIQIDNVGSNQLQQVRIALRGKAVVLLGKNTLITKVLRDNLAANPKIEALIPYVYGNMGFVFTNENLAEVRKIILSNKVPAAARVGVSAPNDVVIPSGSTGLDPGQTSFFQALNIATKIVKGAIEIVNEVTLVKAGDRVSSSHVALLDKLNIRPFQFGVIVSDVYEDGNCYKAEILDMSQDDLMKKFMSGVSRVAQLSMAISYPTAASLSYHIRYAFSKLLAISLATDYTFEQAQKVKDMLANPGAFVQAAASSSSSTAAAAKEEEPEEEEEEDLGGFSLFD